METEVKEMVLNGVTYVKKGSEEKMATNTDGMEYVIIRTNSAGVHAGYLKSRKGKEVVLIDSRRIYYWDGAATLSQLAMDGTASPDNCKFPCKVNEITLTGAIEIIPCTEKARISIEEVKVWTM